MEISLRQFWNYADTVFARTPGLVPHSIDCIEQLLVDRIKVADKHQSISKCTSHLDQNGSIIVSFIPQRTPFDPIVVTKLVYDSLVKDRMPEVQMGWLSSLLYTTAGARQYNIQPKEIAEEAMKYLADKYALEYFFTVPPNVTEVLPQDLKSKSMHQNASALLGARRFLNTPRSIVMLSPEGHIGKDGTLSKAQPAIDSFSRSKKHPPLMILPLLLQDLPSQEHQFKFFTSPRVIVGQYLTAEELFEESQKYYWKASNKPLTMADTITFLTANMGLTETIPNIDPRGMYTDEFIGAI